MNIVVIGATGYLGTAISTALERAGHQLVRTGHRSRTGADGVVVHGVDLADPASFRDLVTADTDAVVHAGAPLGDWAADAAAAAALVADLRDDAAFVYLSGAWVLGPSPTALDEDAPLRPIPLVKGREEVEELVLGSRVRGIVVRPGIAHGHGAGIPALLTAWAAEAGHGRYVADVGAAGDAAHDLTWPVVHVDDLADLVVLAVSDARAGDVLHGVAEEAVSAREIAAAADRAVGGPGRAQPWPLDEASAVLGTDFAGALATGQRVTARRAFELGWSPSRPGLVEDLVTGSYVAQAAAGA